MAADAGKIVKPIHAREGEFVDIHWHCEDGRTMVERRACPPAATRSARAEGRQPATALDVTGPDLSGGRGKVTTEEMG